MNHSVEQLLATACLYHAQDGADGKQAPEARRRTAAHQAACVKYRDWVHMLRRLEQRFPGHAIDNRSIFRQGPDTSVYDLAYSGSLSVPVRGEGEGYRYLGFMASIVVPYYVVYDFTWLEDAELPAPWRVQFTLQDDERPIAIEIGKELEQTFPGCSPMPTDVGQAIVPGVRTSFKHPGEATLYDCLFSDDW
jgi:hypothetical protein